MPTREEIINRLKQYIAANHLSYSKLAAILKVTPQAICSWMNGSRSPSYTHCEQIISLIQED